MMILLSYIIIQVKVLKIKTQMIFFIGIINHFLNKFFLKINKLNKLKLLGLWLICVLEPVLLNISMNIFWYSFLHKLVEIIHIVFFKGLFVQAMFLHLNKLSISYKGCVNTWNYYWYLWVTVFIFPHLLVV